MEIIFSHSTALERYRLESALMPCASICADELRIADVHRLGPTALSASHPGDADIRESALFRRSSLAHAFHVLVPSNSAKRKSRIATFHVCSGILPHGSIVRIGPGELISSPELCFTQMAQTLSLPETVQLGYELCGTYALNNDAMHGMVRRDPLTSPQRIQDFLAAQKLHGGIQRARKALRYILSASASPMETVLAMLLFLPRTHGGYGLPAPTLNGKVLIERHGRTERFICDMIWPHHKLAVEYDSDMVHTGREKINLDSRRRSTLESNGIRVLTVTKDQVKYVDCLDEVAQSIARSLNVRIRTTCKDWPSKQSALRRAIVPPSWR